jgi:hypothetical protein
MQSLRDEVRHAELFWVLCFIVLTRGIETILLYKPVIYRVSRLALLLVLVLISSSGTAAGEQASPSPEKPKPTPTPILIIAVAVEAQSAMMSL